MDLRVKRTRTSIMNAFLALREEKPLEKITVKELSELANINKATFYTHFRDINDLSEHLENMAVQTAINTIEHPEYLVTQPKKGMMELMVAVLKRKKHFQILFSGTRQSFFTEQLEANVKKKIFEIFPEYQTDLEKDMILTVMIQGCFHALVKYQDEDLRQVVGFLGSASESLIQGITLNHLFENLIS